MKKTFLSSPIRTAQPGRTFRRPDMVLHPLQSLIPPSGGTMSIGRAEPPATRTWCFTIRKALFLRPETPRHLGPIEPPAAGAWCFTVRKALFLRPEAPRHLVRLSLRRLGRGASPSAKTYFFVRKHHVYRPGRASGDPDVVLHRPQSLIPPSGGTTSIGRAEPPATRTWCFTVRKDLFLRPEAPRLSAGPSLRRPGRGASPSAKTYFFVRKHHVYRPGRASGDPGFPFPIRRECDEHI